MDIKAMEKRKRIMSRSISLGHCVCDPAKPCPCPLFKEKNICECAGEREEIITGDIKLTEHVRAVGCASKVPKKYLQTVISGLSGFRDSRVLIGNESSDDAGVIAIEGSSRASVLTVDIFAPSVDDPYTFGMIAAANSISDIYAMGAKAEAALSIVGFPIYSLPEEAMSRMLQGGADKLAEAGIAVVGGHSINDSELKCGYAILGSIDPEKIIANNTAEAGDILVLTKPVGGGIVLFGEQIGRTSVMELTEVTTAMTTLNRIAGEAMAKFSAHAATDVTGFSLLGHLAEMAAGSSKEITLDFSRVPLFTAVERLAREDAFPGAVERNREASEEFIDYGDLTQTEQNILYSPETSGGLLVALPQEQADGYIRHLQEQGITASAVGRVGADRPAGIIRLQGSKGITALPRQQKQTLSSPAASSCCCSESAPPAAKSVPETNDSCCCHSAEPQPQPEKSCCCPSEKSPPADSGTLPPPAAGSEFSSYMQVVNKAGAINDRQKKLIALALSVSHKCAECVAVNAAAAERFGASQEEIAEAVALGISFGGASANMFYNELRKKKQN